MAQMTQEEERVRSYLVAQGQKRTPGEIVAKVREAMGELFAAAAAVPAARFGERPEPAEWSGNEVMAHVVDSGRRVAAGILGILDGGTGGSLPEPADTDPVPDTLTIAGWRDLLTRDREALFALVTVAEADANVDRAISISSFGPLSWRAALLFLRVHDLDHAGQLRKIATEIMGGLDGPPNPPDARTRPGQPGGQPGARLDHRDSFTGAPTPPPSLPIIVGERTPSPPTPQRLPGPA